MATTQKDVVYIDVDDEITSIIEKVRGTDNRIVALVLPKRASVLQSVVNMKLLKRTADQAKKHVVLITSEAGLLPLAGAVGMHVANSLQSKPAIPRSPEQVASSEAADGFEDFDPEAAAEQPVGVLNGETNGIGVQAASTAVAVGREPETIELEDETETDDATTSAGASAAADKPLKGTNKKLKVPNFNKFRLILLLGGALLIGLIVFLYFAIAVLPKANVAVTTNTSEVVTNANVTFDPALQTVDTTTPTLPAKIEQKQQTTTQSVATTGQKNNGEKATGEVKIINCNGGEDLRIPAGTGVSSGDLTYVTQEDALMPLESNTCKDTALTADTVKVVAINAGEKYNIAASTFKVAQQDNSAIKATSSDAFTGGTDNNIKIIAQADIDSAKQKIASGDSTAVKSELQQKLQAAGYTAITSSLQAAEPTITPNAAVGSQADAVSVTQVTSYTMYGIKKDDLKKLIIASVEKQIDKSKQEILDDGVSKATFTITSPSTSGKLQTAISAKSIAGPDIRIEDVKKSIAGKKANEAETIIKAIPGVTEVEVKYSPFWVSKIPNKPAKINLTVEK